MGGNLRTRQTYMQSQHCDLSTIGMKSRESPLAKSVTWLMQPANRRVRLALNALRAKPASAANLGHRINVDHAEKMRRSLSYLESRGLVQRLYDIASQSTLFEITPIGSRALGLAGTLEQVLEAMVRRTEEVREEPVIKPDDLYMRAFSAPLFPEIEFSQYFENWTSGTAKRRYRPFASILKSSKGTASLADFYSVWSAPKTRYESSGIARVKGTSPAREILAVEE